MVAMTPMEFADKMSTIFGKRYDEEAAHIDADDLLCEVLVDLGYAEGVKVFNDAHKWYA